MGVLEGIGLSADIVVLGFALGWSIFKLRAVAKGVGDAIRQGLRG